jgi:pyruvate/2-oxoacid:ferredoxin oxidoreductase beta subunit
LEAEETLVAPQLRIRPGRLPEVLAKAAARKGTAFVEIYQNCNIPQRRRL